MIIYDNENYVMLCVFDFCFIYFIYTVRGEHSVRGHSSPFSPPLFIKKGSPSTAKALMVGSPIHALSLLVDLHPTVAPFIRRFKSWKTSILTRKELTGGLSGSPAKLSPQKPFVSSESIGQLDLLAHLLTGLLE